MPDEKKNPYSFARHATTHFVSVRAPEDLWTRLETVAAREQVSMNRLILSLLDLALDADEAALHQACTTWRTRYERRWAVRRAQRSQDSGDSA